ncbi:DegQ family serine endoprotease [Limobrevibacterium gyesilva]|uniref:Probable periplasmic serine endoprotease DegP-like n=1 Tax=Limobrevibacterium gyesilva TaxID=2991712 RepID=A0AA42CEC0_9PROT|nr:DegQ family serine endoprotease [Limobrevibacterium gyesilva]MCW3475863.1 DegQ family serine endoprotease [Limobrevibacterium gyesilva]
MRLLPTRTFRAAALAVSAIVAVPALPAFAPQAEARSAPESFADLAAKLLPGVVNISSSQTLQARGEGRGPEFPVFPPGSPFEQFFKDFMERNRPNGQRGDRSPQAPRRAQSLGSGFIVDPSGIVVTNNHVIDGADEITVILQDNTNLKATVIGRDERTDIAVLKVNSDKPLAAVTFGDSDKARVGDWVVAIGNPFGLGGSVTAGIVSARGRNIEQGPYDNFIQTDAAINKGNSGGPLFNMDGEVIGINTAIYSPSGGSIGIGFSIPANMAKNVVAQLRDYGRARRGWLGVRIQQVTPDIAESVGLKEPAGAMVAGVNEGGPADKAKLRNGDIILKFADQSVKEMRNLPLIVAQTDIGKQVPLVVWRDGKEMTLQATVGELPDDQKVAAATPDKAAPTKSLELSGLGIKLAEITAETRDKFQLSQDQKGVLITDVDNGTPAADRGLKPGDIIVEVQQEEVKTPADVRDRVEKVRKSNRKSVLMLVQTNDGLRWVPLSLAPNPDRKPG